VLEHIFAFKYKTDIKGKIADQLGKKLKDFSQENIRNAINKLQEDYKCCGANNYTDWNEVPNAPKYPGSCCQKPAEICREDEVRNVKGCVQAIEDEINSSLIGIGGVAIAIVLIQLLIVMSACCLAKEVRD